MAIVHRKPRSASLRSQTFIDFSELTKKAPERSLVKGIKKTGGRNSYGRITTRHIGGGAQRLYRVVDFKRTVRDVEGKVVSKEYDPNRNVFIGLTVYRNGAKRYILLPEGLAIGAVVISSEKADPVIGCSLALGNIPVGYMVHNVEITPGSGGKFARSAGTSVQIMGKADGYVTLKMPSGEMRMFLEQCWATVGVLGNADWKNINWGKAGRSRHRGIRPSVRGMAMNPVDHPHGGGEGRSKSGAHPQSPWGKGAKGTRTRTRHNPLIIKRRK